MIVSVPLIPKQRLANSNTQNCTILHLVAPTNITYTSILGPCSWIPVFGRLFKTPGLGPYGKQASGFLLHRPYCSISVSPRFHITALSLIPNRWAALSKLQSVTISHSIPTCPCFGPTSLTPSSPTHSHRSSLVPHTSHSAPTHTLRASPRTPPVPPSPGHGRSHPGTRAAWAPHTDWSCGGSPTRQPGCPAQSFVTGPL
jgi:hypothetical protein